MGVLPEVLAEAWDGDAGREFSLRGMVELGGKRVKGWGKRGEREGTIRGEKESDATS